MSNDMELNLEDLDNVVGGIPKEMVEQKTNENSHLYREQQIEELKKERENLLVYGQQEQESSYKRS